MEIEVDKIHPSPLNPRSSSTPVDVETIKKSGVIERITVRPHPKKRGAYEIVTGERRWRGAKEAGLKTIEAKVEELTDQDVIERQLVENIQREDLNPIEEGKVFRRLKKELGYTDDEIANRIGKSRSYVGDRVSLVEDLAPEVQQEVIKFATSERPTEAYSITISKAQELARLPKPEQLELAERITKRGMYVSDLRGTIRRGKQIEKIIGEVKRPSLRRELKEKYAKIKYEPSLKPQQIEIEVRRAKGLPVMSFEDRWRRAVAPVKRFQAEHEENSRIRQWRHEKRRYIDLVFWMDEEAPPVGKLIREDHQLGEFRDFEEADKYAEERGGYCSGIITIMGKEYWCIYVKEGYKAKD